MKLDIKTILAIWENTKNDSPLQFQKIASFTTPWQTTVFMELGRIIYALNPSKVSIDGYSANPADILKCTDWTQVAELFYPIRLMLLRDEDKHFTISFEGKPEKFHLYFTNI